MRRFSNCCSRIRNCRRMAGFVAVLLIFLARPAWPQQANSDLTERSLEDLMNIKVTSVSKTEQTLSRTASAVFVMTAEEIQRSGATNIPDLLRMVPGIDVAQINANTWAVSARGLNGRFSNELLVTVDGRNVYTPTFGGVFWDVLGLPLEDIERIEVIRGPGGTVWGANAVNGFINIITKKAGETHGGVAIAGAGNLDQGFGTVQYGASLGKKTDFRVYTKYFNQDHLPGLTTASGNDGWHLLRGGFRMDSALSSKDALTVEGNIYTGKEWNPTSFLPSITLSAQDVNEPVSLFGADLQSTWRHSYSEHSETALQVSFDRYKRNDALGEQRNTIALDLQHRLAWSSRQDIVWGIGYRYTDSDSHGNLTISLNPADFNMQLFSSFVQDEVAVIPNKLYVTAGTELEHNRYSGFNWMPSGRISWTPARRHMFWAAVSEAVHTPSELDTSSRTDFGGFVGPGGVLVLAALVGNPHFQDERLTAWELGYRTTPSSRVSIDLAFYHHDYRDQQTTEPATPFFETTPAPPHVVLPVTFRNLMSGEATGFEVASNWKVSDRWTLSPAYAFEQIHMHLDPTSQDTGSVLNAEGSSPANGAQLRSHVDLVSNVAWDTSVYFVDRLRSGKVPSYTRAETGLTWRWTEYLSCSVVGQNLLQDRHLEFVDSTGSVRSSLVKRSAYVKITWQF